MVDQEKSYSKDELAELLRVRPRTVASWANNKKHPLPHEKMLINNGGSWKYKFYENQVREWLKTYSAIIGGKQDG